MIFEETALRGAYLIRPEALGDDRGFFARTWCGDEALRRGLNPCVVQCNVSFNRRRGTIRGMHYQQAPHEEAKLVRCTRGAIRDVILDLRSESDTFRRWVAYELTAENHLQLYIPEGFAHGFQVLQDETEVFYQMSESYAPGAARGVRWDDPAFAIAWPIADPILSDRDRSYPDFTG